MSAKESITITRVGRWRYRLDCSKWGFASEIVIGRRRAQARAEAYLRHRQQRAAYTRDSWSVEGNE